MTNQAPGTVCLTKFQSSAFQRIGWESYGSAQEYALDIAATMRVLTKVSTAVKRTGRVPKYLIKTSPTSAPRAQHPMDLQPGEVYSTLHALHPYGRFSVMANGDITKDGRVIHPESLDLIISTVLADKGLTEVSK